MDIVERNDIEAAITGVCSTFGIHFQKEMPRNIRDVTKNDLQIAKDFYAHMLSKNIIYVSRTLPHCFIAKPHTKEDINEYLAATESFFKDYRI